MSEHKGHEQHEIEDISDVVDHISNLPDCILEQILSFMPTKEAAKTSILSTRWKNLWTSVPIIDIDDKLLRYKREDHMIWLDATSFVNFVERAFRLRDASNMEKFRLSCDKFRDVSQVHSWISDAIMHKVQELDLCLFAKDPSVIPRSMFDSTSLVSLKIRIHRAIELPSHVSFPCLKTLHLSHVQISNDDFTIKLFSGCPVLEELVLSNLTGINLKNIAISSSTLKSLTIRDLPRSMSFDDLTSGHKIKIDAANLTNFEYTGYLSNEVLLNNASSLDKSFIDILNPRGTQNKYKFKLACRAFDLLKQLQYVVSLRLSDCTLEALSFAASTRFPMFPNVTHLKIGMTCTFRVFMSLLSSCPLLQSICFSKGMGFMLIGGNNPIWSSIPLCISNSLKTFTLKDFCGEDPEICFLKCVLKYARVLERMDIIWLSDVYLLQNLKWKTKVMKKLENFERSSAACVINFS